jgi:hypothetical protein
MTVSLMTIGKHKGRPLREVVADHNYCRWLMAQSWLATTHPDLCQALRAEIMKLAPPEILAPAARRAGHSIASEIVDGGCQVIQFPRSRAERWRRVA